MLYLSIVSLTRLPVAQGTAQNTTTALFKGFVNVPFIILKTPKLTLPYAGCVSKPGRRQMVLCGVVVECIPTLSSLTCHQTAK